MGVRLLRAKEPDTCARHALLSWPLSAWLGFGLILLLVSQTHLLGSPPSSTLLTGIWLCSGAMLALTSWMLLRKPLQLLHAQTEQLAHWQLVFTATRQSAWEYDARTRLIRHAPAWKALYGYVDEAADNALEQWLERIHPDDLPRVRAEMERHSAGETTHYESTHRIRRKDGSYRWVQDRGQVIERDAAGAPLRIIGSKLDASNRQKAQELLDHLAENTPGMLYQYQLEPDGRSSFPYSSPNVQDLFGLSPKTLRADASPAFALLHPDDLQATIDSIQHSARTLDVWQADFRILPADGGERWLHGSSRPQRLESGATLWHGYIYDFTEEKQQALRLQETERLLRRLMNDMPTCLCLVDENGYFYFRNRRFQEFFNYPLEQPLTLAQWWQDKYPDPAYREQVIRTWNADLAHARSHDGEIPRRDYRVCLRDGSQRTLAIGGLVFGGHFMAIFEDHTEQAAHTELLRQMAYIDGLTGIANRRHFDEALQVEWRRCQRSGKPLSLLMLDIDHFKAYNDVYGHLQGDACLQAVAGALRTALGRAQDQVARYGGEEFVCLLPECDALGARRMARQLSSAVRELALEHRESSAAKVVTVSIGVATTIPEHETAAGTLLATADANLYRAKQAGRSRIDDGESASH